MTTSDVVRDARHSVRMFWQSPGFTRGRCRARAGHRRQHGHLLDRQRRAAQPVPFPRPTARVFLNTTPQGAFSAASPAKFEHWREQTAVVQDVSAYRTNMVNYTGG